MNPEKAYLVDVDSGDRLEFQFAPGDIDDAKGTIWAQLRVPGMSHPLQQFVAGEQRTVSFTVTFYRIPNLLQRVRWLQSLEYPEHTGQALTHAPHRVMLIFGALFEGVVFTVPSVKVKWGHPYTANLQPMRADVEVNLQEFISRSINYSEVRR